MRLAKSHSGVLQLAMALGVSSCDRTNYTTNGIAGAEPWNVGSIIAAVVVTVVLVGGLVVLPLWVAYGPKGKGVPRK
jgi:hypothetical protein